MRRVAGEDDEFSDSAKVNLLPPSAAVIVTPAKSVADATPIVNVFSSTE